MRRLLSTSTLVIALSILTAAAEEPVNQDVIARIKTEGFQHSQVMETLSWLSDVYGPRLSGSDNLRKAGEWARDQMTRWGLTNAALEPYDATFRGWTLEHFELAMTEPQDIAHLRISGRMVAGDRDASRRRARAGRGPLEGGLREVPRQAAQSS